MIIKIKEMMVLFLISVSFNSINSNSSSDLVNSPESTGQCPVYNTNNKGIVDTTKNYSEKAWNSAKMLVSNAWNSTKENAKNFSNQIKKWWHSDSDSKDKSEVNTQAQT